MSDSIQQQSNINHSTSNEQILRAWASDNIGPPPSTPCIRPTIRIVYMSPEAETVAETAAARARDRLQVVSNPSPVSDHAIMRTAEVTPESGIDAGHTSTVGSEQLQPPDQLMLLLTAARSQAQNRLQCEATDDAGSFIIRKGTPSRIAPDNAGDFNARRGRRYFHWVYLKPARALRGIRTTFRHTVDAQGNFADPRIVRASRMPYPGAKDPQWATAHTIHPKHAAQAAYKAYLNDRRSPLSEVMSMSDVEAAEMAWDPETE